MHGDILSPMMSDALVILGAAGIIIPVFARFRITPVIGFILVGLLVGPYGLGLFVDDFKWLSHVTINETERLEPFAEFGIVLLLFTIGLELSFNRLWEMRKLVFGLGALELIIIGSVLAFGLSMLGQYWTGAMALGLALALSSTALVLPITGTNTPVGRAALSMLLFEDIAIVPIIFMLGALAPYAQSDGLTGLFETIWLGLLVVLAMMVIGRFGLPKLFAQAARTKSPELFLAVSLLVIIGASLVTSMVGLSPIVGALIAGLLIAETEYNDEVEHIIEPFKGLALGVFLITVGMGIDLAWLWDNFGKVALATVLVLSLKAIVTGVLLRLMGARRSTATETGILMASPSETTLIVLTAAASALLIDTDTAQFWKVVTAIGLTITPILAKIGSHVGTRVDPIADLAEVDGDPDVEHAIIIGFGRVGRLVAQMLDKHDQPYIGIDTDSDLIEKARRNGYTAVFGNALRENALEKLGIENATAVILTMDEHILAQKLVKRLRRRFPDLPIIARARDTVHAAELYRCGASTAVPETLESSLQLSEAVLGDLGVAAGPVIASIHEKRDEFRERIKKRRRAGISPPNCEHRMRKSWTNPNNTSESTVVPTPPISLSEQGLHRRNRIIGLAAIWSAALSHIRTPAAALTAKRRNARFHEIDRIMTSDQVFSHTNSTGRTPVIHGDNRRDSAAHAFLRFIQKPAQFFRVHPIKHLARECHAANVFISLSRTGPAPTAKRELFLRFGQLFFETLTLIDQSDNALTNVIRRCLQRRSDILEGFLAANNPLARGLSRQGFNPADTGRNCAFRSNPEQANIASGAHMGTAT